jgi:hypothetical protein
VIESGDNWWLTSGLLAPTITVIEQPVESYDSYHERKKREESGRRVPFGFARALHDEHADSESDASEAS